ncbi:hypothetical protein Srufu_080240 (plasmid) [Streptomyces libani subsp. rufus]|nr:hypothetical protein Srufu_080240 [Streptomyces libani subsp. rufus]
MVHDGWAAGLEEAAAALVELLDGPQAVRAFRERLTGGPAVQQVRHLSEKNPNTNVAAAGGTK